MTLSFLFLSFHKGLGLQTSFLSPPSLAVFAPILGQGFAKAGQKYPPAFYPPAVPLSAQTPG